jgi:outer membrane protein OmpA-like peptidoglycan-associated protein
VLQDLHRNHVFDADSHRMAGEALRVGHHHIVGGFAEGLAQSDHFRCGAAAARRSVGLVRHEHQLLRHGEPLDAETALRQAGFQFVFSGNDAWNNLAVTARKGAQWIFVRLNPSNVQYTVTAVLVKQIAQEMTANAEALAAEIEKSGRVAVYGINFDTAKATIRPDSEPVLNELVKLMTAHADWRFRIEGHTDSTGSKAANQTLSAQRAASVAAWLAGHGIDKSRLLSQGFGDSRPVADNATDEGRAKNRRVELVKM